MLERFYFIITVLVALEFFYIMYLETFATTSEKTAKIFSMSREKLAEKEINNLFKNQGVYNGLLGIALLYGLFFLARNHPRFFNLYCLGCPLWCNHG